MDKICIILKDGRKIYLELYHDVAPKTVENFLKLVDTNFFEGTCFHRVIKDFMIQTGGYFIKDGMLSEKEDVQPIVGEFTENGFENNLSHQFGVISMARTNDPNSASSQFFICSADASFLDGKYAAFGKTIDEESNKVVLDISCVQTGALNYMFRDFPYEPIEIEKIIRIK